MESCVVIVLTAIRVNKHKNMNGGIVQVIVSHFTYTKKNYISTKFFLTKEVNRK